MCKVRQYIVGFVAGAIVVMLAIAYGHAAPVQGSTAECKVTLSQAQEQVAEINGKSIVLVGDQLRFVEAVLRAMSQGRVGLEPGTTAVVLATLPQGPNLIGEFKDGCMVGAGPVPREFIVEVLKLLGD